MTHKKLFRTGCTGTVIAALVSEIWHPDRAKFTSHADRTERFLASR